MCARSAAEIVHGFAHACRHTYAVVLCSIGLMVEMNSIGWRVHIPAPGELSRWHTGACAGREQVLPGVKEVAGKVEPATKDITQGVIRPGGDLISERAVPVTEEFANKRFQPAVEQVPSEMPCMPCDIFIGSLHVLPLASCSGPSCTPILEDKLAVLAEGPLVSPTRQPRPPGMKT
jgi:hypothetical protein